MASGVVLRRAQVAVVLTLLEGCELKLGQVLHQLFVASSLLTR